MKVTLIANISANGRILLADNPHHQLPPEAMEFYVRFVRQVGNVVIGLRTFENFLKFPIEVRELFNGIEIIILADKPHTVDGYKFVASPEEAIEYMSRKGEQEIVVGGGAGTFNAFIDKDLVTAIYFNINPIITGAGAILGNNSELNSKFKHNGQKLKDGFVQLHLAKEERIARPR
ncbi:MAG: dihydrofolate reductase family protein [Sphingobacterium sp.]|uniref:dihydrofolate reductase family protein n=1 Tax=Sphingobacterium sp. JB170 TaxID=1434842 RepID=UPI00097EDCB2|nr:dihydrofolate reductase [Sphingobacterium sp. JB170]SJN27461.1 Bifunctional deaminase-reductase domain protein [Sphingobacterium sp. JB170]